MPDGAQPKVIELGGFDISSRGDVRAFGPEATPTERVQLERIDSHLMPWTSGWRRRLWFAVYYPIAVMLHVLGVRILAPAFPGRIGHLALEIDEFQKRRDLGRAPKIRPVLILRRSLAANEALIDHFRQRLTVWSGPFAWRFLSPLMLHGDLVLQLGAVGRQEDAPAFNQTLADWGDRPPAFPLPEALRQKGRAWLKSLGVPEDAWFVCVHARSSGYSRVDERVQRFRNVNIDNYTPAVEAILERGGYVVRMGDPSMRPFPLKDPRVIDFAHFETREPWMDLFLAAEARFMVCTTSGLVSLAVMFNTPCAFTNMAPHSIMLGYSERDVSIPKLLASRGGHMTFSSIFRSHASRIHSAEDFSTNRIQVIQNSADEIQDLVIEMMDRLDGVYTETEEDAALQDAVRAHFSPADESYYRRGRLGRNFLRRYRQLV